MSAVLGRYGDVRTFVLKYRKPFGIFFVLLLIILLCATYVTEGRPGKITASASSIDYDGPPLFESFSILNSFNQMEEMALGKSGMSSLAVNDAVENLIEAEEEALVQAKIGTVNISTIENKPIYDANGNEIGFRFLSIGDWGGQSKPPYTTHIQKNLARSLAEYSLKYDCSFIISVGDNFCDEGVTTVNDTRFKDTFEDVLTEAFLETPWYIIAGDKDYKGNVSAEIEYSKRSKRWNFEDKYYITSSKLPSYNDLNVEFVMIDTVQLCGEIPDDKLQPSSPNNITEAENQWDWIENKLKTSKSEYLIVVGHYPVYSGGHYGSTKCLIDRLEPMLDRYRVSAYIGGHDHSVQHIKSPSQGGVHYFVNAAASSINDHPEHLDSIYSDTKYYWTNHIEQHFGAFLYCDVRKDKMTVVFVKSDQTLLYSTFILPRSHPANTLPNFDSKNKKITVMEKHRPSIEELRLQQQALINKQRAGQQMQQLQRENHQKKMRNQIKHQRQQQQQQQFFQHSQQQRQQQLRPNIKRNPHYRVM